jgi:HSP20 family protein
MSPIFYEPLNHINYLQKELEKLFGSYKTYDDQSSIATCDWIPAVDIFEKRDCYVLHADVPGVDPKDIEIIAENGKLTIRGERPEKVSENSSGYRRTERPTGSFYRLFNIPDTADLAGVAARIRNGVLEITIPRLDHTISKTVKVEEQVSVSQASRDILMEKKSEQV